MEDIRELQRKKWLKAQDEKKAADASSAPADAAGAASSASGYTAAPAPPAPMPNASGSSSSQAPHQMPAAAASSSSAPNSAAAAAPESSTSEPKFVRRIHILPVGPEADYSGQPRLQMLASELRRFRNEKVRVRTGLFIKSSGAEFVVVKADPDDAMLSSDTDYFVDGEFALRFNKVQFICLKDFQSGETSGDPTVLFSEYISPYFKSINDSNLGIGNVVAVGDSVTIFDRDFKVIAAEPQDRHFGIIDKDTMVFVDWDSTPEFEKIHIVPFQDTLPGAYEYDIFNDYLKPYLTRNKHAVLSVNDQFTYHSVQFKVVCCEPNGPARIGRNTTIYCEGQLHPSLRNLLPPELLEQLSHLPPGLQMLLMNTEALAGGYEERLMEVQEMLSRRRGLSGEVIDSIETFTWDPSSNSAAAQTQCMICLSDFETGDEVRRLPCGHIFHKPCIDEWLRRCTDCPICKANVDRAVRQY